MIGSKVVFQDDDLVGTVVDSMLACDTKQLSYVVISQGGVGGVGETLRAIGTSHIQIDDDKIVCDLTAEEITRLPVIEPDKWPASASDPVSRTA